MSETFIEKIPADENLKSKDTIKKTKHQNEKYKARDLVFKYLDETTIHGVRFVGKRDSTICIRLLWLFVFLVCSGLMTVQIFERIIYFADWPITVDVRVNYKHSLPFPALTICNQNAFKTSASAANGQYDLIEEVFSTNVKCLDKYSDWNNTTLRKLYLNNGHRKEDMIIECKWAGQKCKDRLFSTTVTDHGLCFTFNGPQEEDRITALASGELGQALQTGTHTFVGVQMLKLHNLKSPHGDCGNVKLKYLDDYAYTLSACTSDCRAQILMAKCGCLDFYFPLKKGYRSCTIEDVPCIFSAKDAIRTESDGKCHCPVLCDSNHFESEISFGSITNFALQKFMKNIHVSTIKSKFVRTKEISQKVWKHAAKNFEEIISNLEEQYWNYNFTVYGKLQSAIAASYEDLQSVYEWASKYWKKKQEFYEFQDFVFKENILRGIDQFEERYFTYVAINPYGFPSYLKDMFSSLLNTSVNHTLYCVNGGALRNIRAILVSRLVVAEKGRIRMKRLIKCFENGTPINNYKFREYSRLKGRLIMPKTLMKRALERSKMGYEAVKSIQKIIDILEKYLSYTGNIAEGRQININYIEELNKKFTEQCKYFYKYKAFFYRKTVQWTQQELNKRIALFEEKIHYLNASYNEIEMNFRLHRDSLHDVWKTLSLVKESFSFAKNYTVNRSITKMDLYNKFHSSENAAVPGIIDRFTSETYARSTTNVDSWTAIFETIKEIFKIIIYDDDMTEFYEYENVTEFLQNFTIVSRNIDSTFRNKDKLWINYGLSITGLDKKLLDAYKQTVDHLADFANSLKIGETFFRPFQTDRFDMTEPLLTGAWIKQHSSSNENNFIKLEVFYRELRYEEIRQQPAYDIFALLCDIGGSIGLFIGASVISLFELIDLLCHIMLTRRFGIGRKPLASVKDKEQNKIYFVKQT